MKDAESKLNDVECKEFFEKSIASEVVIFIKGQILHRIANKERDDVVVVKPVVKKHGQVLITFL